MSDNDNYIYTTNPAYYDEQMLERMRMRDSIERETRRKEREALAILRWRAKPY